MRSISPIKSKNFKEPLPYTTEETGDKSVITSVHGIMSAEFPILSILNRHLSKSVKQLDGSSKKMGIQTSSRYLLPNKEVKTIKIQMPVLGLESAVVYPRIHRKPPKLQLRKKLFRKARFPEKSGTSLNIFSNKLKKGKKIKKFIKTLNKSPKLKEDDEEKKKKQLRKGNKSSESRKSILKGMLQLDEIINKQNMEEIGPFITKEVKSNLSEKIANERILMSLEREAKLFLQKYDPTAIIEEEQLSLDTLPTKSRQLLLKTEEEIVKQLLSLNPEEMIEEPQQPKSIKSGLLITTNEVAPLVRSKEQTSNEPVMQKKSSQGSRIPKLKRNIKSLKKAKVTASNSKQFHPDTLQESKVKLSRVSLGSTSTLKRLKSLSKSSVSRSSNRLGGQKLESISKTSQSPVPSKSSQRYSKMNIDYIGEQLSKESLRRGQEDKKPTRESRGSKVSTKQIKEIKDILEGVPLSNRKLVLPKKIVKQ